jgi:integrase
MANRLTRPMISAFDGGMPKPRPPFIRRESSRHGKTVWYFRRKGQDRIRLPDTYGSPEFWAAYNAALAGDPVRQVPVAVSGSVSWLISRYRQSAAYQSAASSTRRMRDNILRNLDTRIGSYSYASIKRKHIIQAMEDRRDTPHAANNFLKIIRGLFNFAVYHDLIPSSPCDGVKKLKAQTDGFHTWTVDEVRQFQAHHHVGTMPRLALDLMLYTGLRRGDVVTVGRQHVRDGVLTLKASKTGAAITATIYPALQASIDAVEGIGLAFIETERGQPFASPASFGNWFRKQCIAAGLPDRCRAHGLRKAGATIAAQSGATTRELMAMYGWSGSAMADLYTKAVDRQALAAAAGERIADRLGPHLEPGAALNGKKANENNG